MSAHDLTRPARQFFRHDNLLSSPSTLPAYHDNFAVVRQKFAYDVDYVNHASFALDVKIIFMTIRCVFAREGISAEGSATMEAFTGTSNISEEVR